jgi:hypothetical protein
MQQLPEHMGKINNMHGKQCLAGVRADTTSNRIIATIEIDRGRDECRELASNPG